ncbi:MAG: VOC family protein [Pseudomonadota bacterium]|nr:MAG: glyoxalase [Pseudomonadota bacterium]
MNPVIHFEMSYEDHQRLSAFYSKAFGWEMNRLGEEYGGYVIAMTAESDENGTKVPNTINGGFYDRKACPEGTAVTQVVIRVENIEESMRRVGEAGGKVLMDPMQIPNVGTYTVFLDTEGNRVAMLQPAPAMR